MSRLSKEERQRLIQSVVTRRRLGTQLELEQALAAGGLRGHAGDTLP